MLTFLHSPIAAEQSNLWLEQALAQKTNNADTHPCQPRSTKIPRLSRSIAKIT
ncbi:hypothetical protein QUB63_12150 [Microcoleus sp. ARI1-B5]|uniref:hypothetical protein n=1 Tax=unclassified Microcoleus TaxID=2642155 RepID=UPI002FD5FD0B